MDHARPGWGDRLYGEVFDAIDHVERDSEAWQSFDGIGDERRFVLRRFPCVLIYLETETEIVITAVVYGGREPGYCAAARASPTPKTKKASHHCETFPVLRGA